MEILNPLTDQTVVEHEPFTFLCQVSKPNAKARWLKDGQEIVPAPGLEIIVDGQKHELVKKDAVLNDQGKYTIVVENKSSSASLGVSGTGEKFCNQTLEMESIIIIIRTFLSTAREQGPAVVCFEIV